MVDFRKRKSAFLFIKAVCSHCTRVWKLLVKFFSKNLRGFGASSPIITALSFCQAFSLRLLCQRKSGIMEFSLCLNRGKKTFKKAFLPPNSQPSRTLKLGSYFFVIISALDDNKIKFYYFSGGYQPPACIKFIRHNRRACHPEWRKWHNVSFS